MVEENTTLISQGRYWQVSQLKVWKEATERYQEEKGLEESIFMESDEFESLEQIINYRPGVLEFIQTLSENTWISSPRRTEFRKEYFSVKDSLTELGLIANEMVVRWSDKGRAFIFEYGRRMYESK